MNILNYNSARGYRLGDCVSCVQKAIRRGDTKLAGYFAHELVASGYAGWLWKRLLVISAEDCWGCITAEIEALARGWEKCKIAKDPKKGRIFISKAIILLCEVAKHNRDADSLQCLFYDIPEKLGSQAEKFAAESGATVGDIQSANQGIIEINPAVEIPNDRPDKQIDKKVRVVTTITYFLSD